MSIWKKIKSAVDRLKPKDLRAMVLLLDGPRVLDATSLGRLLSELGFPANDITQRAPHWLKIPSLGLELLQSDAPYLSPRMDIEAIAQRIGEVCLRDAFLAHTAFISVVVECRDPERLEDTTKLAYRLAAKLVDESTLAVWDTLSNRLTLPTEEVLAGLEVGDVSAFEYPTWDPVVDVEDTVALEAATQEARDRFPEFRKAFEEDKLDAAFVKFGFENRTEGNEHMWVAVDRLDESTAYGKVANDPHDVPGLQAGSEVTVPIAEISDWMYVRKGKTEGRFLDRVLR